MTITPTRSGGRSRAGGSKSSTQYMAAINGCLWSIPYGTEDTVNPRGMLCWFRLGACNQVGRHITRMSTGPINTLYCQKDGVKHMHEHHIGMLIYMIWVPSIKVQCVPWLSRPPPLCLSSRGKGGREGGGEQFHKWADVTHP